MISTTKKLLQLGILFVIAFNISVTGQDSTTVKQPLKKDFSHESIKKGERLFYGLINLGENTKACISCHNIEKNDSFSWNPSAIEIANVYKDKSAEELKNVLLSATGKKMSESHTGYTLTDEQIGQLSAFLTTFAKEGPPASKKMLLNRVIFILLILLILFGLLDAIFFHTLKFKAINLVIILVAGFLLTKVTVQEAIAVGRSQGYEPDQPIKFSHAVHARQNKIDCLYCHASAESSKVAGIPSANVCLNCHTLVREGTRSGKFEINKIHAAIEKNQPIQWVKIHNLPDYTYFNHSQHVTVGKVSCQTCHGAIENMDRVKQVQDLSMGWCINCHRTTEVQFTKNAFYDRYEKLHKDLKEGKIDRVTASKVGGTDCMKCHY